MSIGRKVALARHVVEVVAPPMDTERLGSLLAAAFGATSVRLRTTVSLRDDGEPAFGRLSRLGTRIMDVLADGKPWRSKHLVERVADGRKPATVRHKLDVLWDEGRITKPRSGVWLLAGMPEPSAAEIPPLRTERVGGPTGRKVLARLDAPTSSNTLVEELGVTRQRVDQILKALLSDGKVVRVPEPGTQGRWLWMRAEINVRSALRGHAPSLPDGRIRVLNALAPDAVHWIGDVADTAGQVVMAVRNQVVELEARGLAVSFRLGQKRYVGVTPRGLEHPARAASSRAAVADMSRAFGRKRIAFLETLSVLGEARTIDITGALAGLDRPGVGLMSGQQIAALTRSDFAEAVPGEPGRHPLYRLTEAGRFGAAMVARHRTPPDRDDVLRRSAAYRERKSQILREAAIGKVGVSGPAASPGQAAILEALASGPLPTPALQRVVAPHVKDPRSISLMLKTLSGRGAIMLVGMNGLAKVWSLSQ